MTTATERPIFIFVDVDDTLERSVGTKRIPMPAVISHVRMLHAEGAQLYCWSSGGADYAKTSATECGLADGFVGFLPKPEILLDDRNLEQWRRLAVIHPNECSSMTLGDYRARSRSRRPFDSRFETSETVSVVALPELLPIADHDSA